MKIEHLIRDCIMKELDENGLTFTDLYNRVTVSYPGLKVEFFKKLLRTQIRNGSILYDKELEVFSLK